MDDIYILIDPLDGKVFYVGKTGCGGVRERLNKHLVCKTKTPVALHLQILISKGLKPAIELIDTCLVTETVFWENHYMCLFRSWGFKLLNVRHNINPITRKPNQRVLNILKANNISIHKAAKQSGLN